MTETPGFLTERLRAEGEKTVIFFRSLSAEQWEQTVYTEGSIWRIREVLAHYMTAEKGFLGLFRDILNGGPGIQQDFDIDRFNASQQKKVKGLSNGQLIEQFIKVRAEMVALVSGLSVSDLQNKGRHPFLEEATLEDMIKMVYRHNQIHYRDIRKLIAEI
jgi:hypothetical protein